MNNKYTRYFIEILAPSLLYALSEALGIIEFLRKLIDGGGIELNIIQTRIFFITFMFGFYFWRLYQEKQKEDGIYNPSVLWTGTLLLGFIAVLIISAKTPNLLNRYTFEVNDEKNECWRVRADQDGQPLGISALPSTEASRLGKSSLAFDLTLPNPYFDSTHPTIGQQVDLKTESHSAQASLCSGTWEIPYEGRIQTWVCLPNTPSAEDREISAEFFVQMENGNWNASAPVMLEPGHWVRLVWAADHDMNATWRKWTETLDYTSRANAFGIEIKLDETSPQKNFTGRVYIDEVVILKNDQPYSLSVLNMYEYSYADDCP